MKTEIILCSALLLVSGGVLAGQLTLKEVGMQLAMGDKPSVEVKEAQGAKAVDKIQQDMKTLKQDVKGMPEAVQQQTQEQLKDAASRKLQEATPDEIKQGAETLEKVKGLKQGVETSPDALKQQAQEQLKDAATQKLQEATPEEVKQGVETLKSGKETVEQIKGTVDAAPKSADEAVDAATQKAKQKAAEKALELLQ